MSPESSRPGRGCWRPLLIAVAVMVTGGLVGLIALDRMIGDYATHRDIKTDERALGATNRELDVVGRLILSLPKYPGTELLVSRGGCFTESGDLFQPSVGGSWSVNSGSAEQVAEAIAGDLSDIGWSVAEPDRWGQVRLDFDSGDGWGAGGYLDVYGSSVSVGMGIKDARPCALS